MFHPDHTARVRVSEGGKGSPQKHNKVAQGGPGDAQRGKEPAAVARRYGGHGQTGLSEMSIGTRGAWRMPERPGGLVEETSGPNYKKGNLESEDTLATSGEVH